jgi:hypothetical protein
MHMVHRRVEGLIPKQLSIHVGLLWPFVGIFLCASPTPFHLFLLGKSLHGKIKSYNYYPSIPQIAPRVNYSTKEFILF